MKNDCLSPTMTWLERRWLIGAASVVLFFCALPYLACVVSAGTGMAFTGIIVNPSDGMSYLAKMRLGWEGGWVFHLPYTIEQGPGGILFLYYVSLGHLAHLFDLPLAFVFHAARILAGFILLWLAYRLIACVTDSVSLRRQMWWLVAVSSGLGWLVGKFSLGFSYYEYQAILVNSTFYCLIANAHFPMAIALMLAMFIHVLKIHQWSWRAAFPFALFSWLLAMILPFLTVVVYLVLGVVMSVIWRRDRVFPKSQFIITLLGGASTLPILLYMHVVSQADPTLMGWSKQNITPSPSPLGFLFSYGLLLVFLVPGVRLALRRKSDWDILLLAWAATTVVLMYIPYSLQNRFSTGLHIPIAILAAQGLAETIRADWPRRLVVVFLAATSVYLVLNLLARAPVDVAVKHYKLMYISKHELAAYDWLRANAPLNNIVLGSPETGLLIPAYTGHKVLYGHLFETIDAAHRQALVQDFFSGKTDQAQVLRQYAVNYVLMGARERAFGEVDAASLGLKKAFNSGDVDVYQVTR